MGAVFYSAPMTLYGAMDQAALDAAYNNSAAVADSARWITDWERRSAALRQAMPAHLDLRYGPAERECIDFFAASEHGGPTLAFIHGGYWQSRTKETFSVVAEGPLSRGINVATIGYTLAPAARVDQIVAQCRRGVQFLHARLAELGGDPRRLHLSGRSAGGHLTAMLVGEPMIAGALAISGIYDLEPIRLSYLNEKLGLDIEEARRNSPLLHLPSDARHLIVTVGEDELPELRRQSASYAAAWQAQGLPGEFLPLAGRHHYSMIEELVRPNGAVTEALVRLVA